jgi:hypothetical protein
MKAHVNPTKPSRSSRPGLTSGVGRLTTNIVTPPPEGTNALVTPQNANRPDRPAGGWRAHLTSRCVRYEVTHTTYEGGPTTSCGTTWRMPDRVTTADRAPANA